MSKSDRYLFMFIRYFLGFLFIYAASGKLADPLLFSQTIENYQVFGTILSRWAAVIVPFLEMLLGLMLIGGIWLKEATSLTLFLYLMFDALVLQAYFRGLDISCGCFSQTGESPIDFWKLAENALLTGLAVYGYYLARKAKRSLR